ncbi:hypothetical protein [Pseudolysinimonas sp.]|jgi:hypothetical protein|uniref:hypothetical protein n=1 Tax=Pseudolysinimonas sp. TaxID=2680009 RepID=UPI003784CE47
MFFDPHAVPADIPPPPTADDVARRFGVPLLTFRAQESLEESGVGTVAIGDVVTEVALSFTLWRNPGRRDDPRNLAELSDELRASLDAEPPKPLPEWMLAARERMRYPTLWEAVRTTRVGAGVQLADEQLTAELVLLRHVDYVLMNTFRDERVRGGFPGQLLGPPTAKAIESGVPVSIDGTDVDGIRLDTDAHVYALAADLGDRILTAVIPRDELPYVRLEFATR